MIQNFLIWFIPGFIAAIIYIVCELFIGKPTYYGYKNKIKIAVLFIFLIIFGPISIILEAVFLLYFLIEWLMDY